jgi:hypothetical protein
MSRSSHRGVFLLLFSAGCLLSGCDGSSREPSAEERHLKALAVLTGQYRGSHKGKAPANLDALKAHVAKLDAKTLQTLNVDPNNREALFLSTRDQKPFVYRPTTSSVPQMTAEGKAIRHVLFHETDGSGGRRWIADSLGAVEEVGASEFEKLVQEKP